MYQLTLVDISSVVAVSLLPRIDDDAGLRTRAALGYAYFVLDIRSDLVSITRNVMSVELAPPTQAGIYMSRIQTD